MKVSLLLLFMCVAPVPACCSGVLQHAEGKCRRCALVCRGVRFC